MKLTIVKPTWLKKKLKSSTELLDSQKVFMRPNETIGVYGKEIESYQHVKVYLSEDCEDFAYFYLPHVNIQESDIESSEDCMILNVPSFTQNDNDNTYHGPGYRQCNLTSNAMMLAYLKPDLYKSVEKETQREFETYYGEILNRYGDSTDHTANTKALRDCGIESYFSTSLTLNDIVDSIKLKIPVVLGVAYKASGHIIVCTGYDLPNQVFYMNDPYGVRFGTSNQYEVGSAKDDVYSINTMDAIWRDLGPNSGWGRVVTSIDGERTGLT
ncbi:MAG: C39 family peptidase [Trichodesmium sp. MAG_R03]|nr:C39 family peptidase [Trichodesmium sp. MAG_R03]